MNALQAADLDGRAVVFLNDAPPTAEPGGRVLPGGCAGPPASRSWMWLVGEHAFADGS